MITPDGEFEAAAIGEVETPAAGKLEGRLHDFSAAFFTRASAASRSAAKITTSGLVFAGASGAEEKPPFNRPSVKLA